jgi:hypothetical protein
MADGGGPRPYDNPEYASNSRWVSIDGQMIVTLWYIWGDGITPLMKWLDYKLSQSLINRGDDPNDQDIFGRTALMLHSFFEDKFENGMPIIQFLIENGANINIRDNEGRTALFYAIWGVNIEGIHLLIERGADVNIIDNKGYTPLDIARIRGTLQEFSIEMIRILSSSGAKNRIVIDDKKIDMYRDDLVEYGWWPEDLYISYSDR